MAEVVTIGIGAADDGGAGQRAEGQGGQKAKAPLAVCVWLRPVETFGLFVVCGQRVHLLYHWIYEMTRFVYSMPGVCALR